MLRSRPVLLAAAGGVLAAGSLPPWGWWPLGMVGVALLALALHAPAAHPVHRPRRRAARLALAFSAAQFAITLFWITEFNALGWVLLVLLESSFLILVMAAIGSGVTDRGWRSHLALPAALIVAEWGRSHWPFGGLPMGGLALGQVGGPLLAVSRAGGALLVLGLVASAGLALAALVERRGRAALVTAALTVAVAGAAWLAPNGGVPFRAVKVAVVQGGGRRGLRAIRGQSGRVTEAHLAASQLLSPPLDMVLWPENVVDLDEPLATSTAKATLAAVAAQAGAPLVAGVTEGEGDGFRNAAVVVTTSGDIASRYEKVHRVPFGEWIPGRALISKLVDLSDVPRDAIPGHGPGVLSVPGVGQVAVGISYEVFDPDRLRSGVAAGGHLLLVPTNAASFHTSQVPTMEIAASRLRAVEMGRDLLQAAPTGYSAVVDQRGVVRRRSTLGRRQVITAAVSLRSGRTPYSRTGDAPVLFLALFALVVAGRRSR